MAPLPARLAGARERIRRFLRPPRVLRPTRPGWLFLLIILGVGFAALNTGNNLLYLVLSLMLAFLVLSGVMSESALRGIEVRRHLPREIFAGRENSVHVEIRNTQRRVSSYAVTVEDRLRAAPDGSVQILERTKSRDGEERKRRGQRKRRGKGRGKRRNTEGEPAGRCFSLRVPPGRSEHRRYVLSPAQRGALAFESFRVSTRFPFGLFLKYREIEAPEETLVYPAVQAFDGGPQLRETPKEGASTLTRRDEGSVVSGLREFTDGDSMRRVHWRSSLRRGSLLVTETEDERDAEVEVRLHAVRARAAATPPPEGCASPFEQSVSVAASEVIAHLQRGMAVALRTDATYLNADAGARQRARLLSFLARVGPDGLGSGGDEPGEATR